MSERLAIGERGDGFHYLVWMIDGEEGMEIRKRTLDAEGEAINAAVLQFSMRDPDQVIIFETMKKATLALRAARAAVKSFKSAKPWPDWAITASANGWKPPKSWAP